MFERAGVEGAAAVEVADPHLGRREQRAVDLVEVVGRFLEDLGERAPVVARVRDGSFCASSRAASSLPRTLRCTRPP
jgi:hypothetical protein